MAESIDQFAFRLKTKYPDKADIPNDELVRSFIARHPEFSDQVDIKAPAGGIQKAIGFVTGGHPLAQAGKALPGMISKGLGEVAAAGRFGVKQYKRLAGAQAEAAGRLGGPALGVPAAIGGAVGETLAETFIPQDRLAVAMMPAMTATGAKVAGRAAGKIAGPVWRGVKKIGTGALERSTALFSQIPQEAWEALRRNPEIIAKYARQGMTVIPETGAQIARAMQRAQELGVSAQGRIAQVAKGAGKEFSDMMKYMKRDKSGIRFPRVAQDVYDAIEPFIETQTAYRSPVKAEATEKSAKIFNHFYDRIKATLQEGMSPGEAADLFQQMTAEQAEHLGKPIAAHLAELKKALMDALPGEYVIPTIDTPTPGGPGIKGVRAGYRAAKELQREASTFFKAHAPVTAFGRMVAQGGRPGRALKKAIKRVPGFAEDITAMQQARGGAAFAPQFSQNLPRTGLTGGAALMLTRAFKNPATMAMVPLELLGMTPRLAMETYLAAGKGAAALESFVVKNAARIPPAVVMAYNASKTSKTGE